MPDYTFRRTRDWSAPEKALRRGGWPFVILEHKGASQPKVVLAVASDGLPPVHPHSKALAQEVVRLLSRKKVHDGE